MERLPLPYHDSPEYLDYQDDELFEFGEHPVEQGSDDGDDYADERPEPLLPARGGKTTRRPPRRKSKARSRYNRAFGWAVALAVILLLAAVAWVGTRELLGLDYKDFAGNGEQDLVVQVADGDTTGVIAGKLVEAGVVASNRAFIDAAEGNARIRAIPPGYYVIKSKMAGANAVRMMADPKSRVGELEIRSGTQLDDLHQPNGTVTNGILTKLSLASCAKLNGKSTCVPVKRLREVSAKADLVALGAPEWLVSSAMKAPPERRLEGLVMPGLYDVRPGWTAEDLIREVLTTSRIRLETSGLPDGAKGMKRHPYQTVVIASIIEREAVNQDFEKVSRVIYNRLAKKMRLEMDSTINYVLDRPEVRTKSTDRARAGAYNTYRNLGLPPTPISAPSVAALRAAQQPAEGRWLFFVKCEKNGLSCFADTLEQHQQNVRDAQARGAY